jgi:hypothetical protein
MDTNAIINAAMQQFVSTVADEVIRRLKAESSASMALDKDALAAAVLTLMQFDTDIREEVRGVSDEHHFDIENADAFTDLKAEVEALTEKLDEMETNGSIDAEDSDFADAVRQVIRDNI